MDGMISCERECEPSPQNNYGKKKLSRFTITNHKPLFPRELGGLLVFFRDFAFGKCGCQAAHDGGDGKACDKPRQGRAAQGIIGRSFRHCPHLLWKSSFLSLVYSHEGEKSTAQRVETFLRIGKKKC